MSSSPRLIVCVSSGTANVDRRRSVRRSWFQFKHDPSSPLPPHLKECVEVLFVITRPADSPSHSEVAASLLAEQEQHRDILLVDAPEGYHNLWRKALVSLAVLAPRPWDYYMHADDDSYVRLDLLLPILACAPRSRFYWGYIWDGSGNRTTAPIRNPRNKSYMPVEQYPADTYPPFASGCGFILSKDLVEALLAQPLPDYRLLDPPFGIHLCGTESCVAPGGPVVPVHDPRVRPYRGIPIFHPTTLVQHYLHPEEMRPFHSQVMESLAASAAAAAACGVRGTAGVGVAGGSAAEPAAGTSWSGAGGEQHEEGEGNQAYDTCSDVGPGAADSHSGQDSRPRHHQQQQQQQLQEEEEKGEGHHDQQQHRQQVDAGEVERQQGGMSAGPSRHPSPAHELYALLVDMQLLRR